MAENREYKSDVFSMLLEEPKHALEVYNRLNGTDYDNPDEVEIYMLEKGVSLSVRNDASFIVDANLNLYEHQSTYSPNIPLRNLIYFTSLVQKLISSRDLYGRRIIKIPTPHFAVFYNGTENRPEKEELCLSESFEHAADQPEIELRCTVYNLNPGNNTALLEGCGVLKGYMYFVEKVRFYKEHYEDLTQAIETAIDDCISNHVLEDFFRSRRAEVIKMTQLDYTWERREELIRAEERQEAMELGIKQGIEQGMGKGVDLFCDILQKLKQGISPEELRAQGVDENVLQKALSLL
jgi:hypothetical protein